MLHVDNVSGNKKSIVLLAYTLMNKFSFFECESNRSKSHILSIFISKLFLGFRFLFLKTNVVL